MLKVERLVVEHGAIRAIDGISFEVATGSLAAVIGSNGAGKNRTPARSRSLAGARRRSRAFEAHRQPRRT
ncbi:MAG: ABC transporter ATP-binding protein, partial [Candidatus Nanopelagicaceae bacterium]